MPGISTVHLDKFLTNVSVAYLNADFYGERLFPVLPVDRQTNKYPVFGKEKFRIYEDSRRPSDEAREIDDWRLSSDQYYAAGHAMRAAIADELKSNSDIPDLEIETVQNLTNAILLRLEANTYNLVFGAGTPITTTALSGTSQWSDYTNSDPIAAVEAQKITIFQNTGRAPNAFAVSYPVFIKLRQHPKIIDRFKYTQVGILQPDHLKTAFDVENFWVLNALKETANQGQASSLDYVWAKTALLSYVPPAPGRRTVALGYTFRWTGDGILADTAGVMVKRYREEKRSADVVEVHRYYDNKIVTAAAAYGWTAAVA